MSQLRLPNTQVGVDFEFICGQWHTDKANREGNLSVANKIRLVASLLAMGYFIPKSGNLWGRRTSVNNTPFLSTNGRLTRARTPAEPWLRCEVGRDLTRSSLPENAVSLCGALPRAFDLSPGTGKGRVPLVVYSFWFIYCISFPFPDRRSERQYAIELVYRVSSWASTAKLQKAHFSESWGSKTRGGEGVFLLPGSQARNPDPGISH